VQNVFQLIRTPILKFRRYVRQFFFKIGEKRFSIILCTILKFHRYVHQFFKKTETRYVRQFLKSGKRPLRPGFLPKDFSPKFFTIFAEIHFKRFLRVGFWNFAVTYASFFFELAPSTKLCTVFIFRRYVRQFFPKTGKKRFQTNVCANFGFSALRTPVFSKNR